VAQIHDPGAGHTPNDVYDVDGAEEHVLADMQVGGQPREVMIQANKNGFVFVLDRRLEAEPRRRDHMSEIGIMANKFK
jgi:glucose dehydrogenase